MTLQEAKSLIVGDYIYHTKKSNASGFSVWGRVLSVKVWKRQPDRVTVRVRLKKYTYVRLTEHDLIVYKVGYGA